MAQKDSLQPLAAAMFAAATGAFSTLAGIGATAGDPEMESADGSIKVRIPWVKTAAKKHSTPATRATWKAVAPRSLR